MQTFKSEALMLRPQRLSCRSILRVPLSATLEYRGLSPSHRASVDALLDALPAIFDRAARDVAPSFCEQGGEVVDNLFAPKEAASIAQFLKTPSGSALTQATLKAPIDHTPDFEVVAISLPPGWQDGLKAMEMHLDIRKALIQQRTQDLARQLSKSMRLPPGLDRFANVREPA